MPLIKLIEVIVISTEFAAPRAPRGLPGTLFSSSWWKFMRSISCSLFGEGCPAMPQTNGSLKTSLMWQTPRYSQDLAPILQNVCVLPRPLTFLPFVLQLDTLIESEVDQVCPNIPDPLWIYYDKGTRVNIALGQDFKCVLFPSNLPLIFLPDGDGRKQKWLPARYMKLCFSASSETRHLMPRCIRTNACLHLQ